MTRIEGDPSRFYDKPYVLSEDEARDFGHLHLSPQEANFLINESINNDTDLRPEVLNILRAIRDSEEGGDYAYMMSRLDDR